MTVYTLGKVIPLIITTFAVYAFTPLLSNALMHNYLIADDDEEVGIRDDAGQLYLEIENLNKLQTVK